MRTATLTAALLVTLAACGGDGGLSLTEPNQVDLTACTPTSAPLAGGWRIGEWGCVGRASPTGAIDCDPDALPWFDGQEIDLAPLGVETLTLTIGAASGTAQPSGSASVSASVAGGQMSVTTCADESALIEFIAGSDTFAAYAHRR